MGRPLEGDGRHLQMDQRRHPWVRQRGREEGKLFGECGGLLSVIDSPHSRAESVKIHLCWALFRKYFSRLLYQPLSAICEGIHKHNGDREYMVCWTDDFLQSNCGQVWIWGWPEQKRPLSTPKQGRIPIKIEQYFFGGNQRRCLWTGTLSKTHHHRNGSLHQGDRIVEGRLQ